MNYYYPHDQTLLIISMLLTGVIIGIIYDMFVIKQKLIFTCLAFAMLDDILFSFISVIVFLSSSFLFNSGIIRWYCAVACVIGFAIYRKTLSIPIMAVMLFLVKVVHVLIRFLLKFLLLPLKISAFVFKRPLRYIYRIKFKLKLGREITKLTRVW